MELIRGWVHRAFPIDDASRVGEARRHAAELAQAIGLPEVATGQLAIIVNELGYNLLRHAKSGRLLLAAREAFGDVEVLAIDEGPGIPNISLAMRDGHSSGSTPGTGLGAVRRLASAFDIHSAVPDGTVCVARVRRGAQPAADRGTFMLGGLCIAAPGETACGDAWAAAIDGGILRLLVADGLGHGPGAAQASVAAVQLFIDHPRKDLRSLMSDLHVGLQTTRGAAVCLMSIEPATSRLSYVGAGNIVGRLVSGIADRSIVTQHGTAGVQVRRAEESTQALPPHAMLVLHSDGIETRWKPDRLMAALRRDPALIAAMLWRDHTRHRDDSTVVVLRLKEPE